MTILRVSKDGIVSVVNKNTGWTFFERELLMETQMLVRETGLDGALAHVTEFEESYPNLRKAVDRALDFLTGVESRR